MRKLNVVLIKPTHYRQGDWLLNFNYGFMPNTVLQYIHSLTPDVLGDTVIAARVVDEGIQQNLSYLQLLDRRNFDAPLLVALVGVQSQQMHRALDLAAFAKRRGAMVIIGGPHCISTLPDGWEGKGISIAQSEADRIWPVILQDACDGQLQDVYGGSRWSDHLDPPVMKIPSRADRKNYLMPMTAIYPFRGCPFGCTFCTIPELAGRAIRSQPIPTTIASLLAAQADKIELIMITSDNFNKYPHRREMLQAMIDAGITIPFFCQCDTQLLREPELVELMARANCFEVFIGMESFDPAILSAAHKFHNKPADYSNLSGLLTRSGINCHLSNMIVFPKQTPAGILEQYRLLSEIGPSNASFYILTPIPGTPQYDDFLKQDLIRERNLDWFDSTNLVWEQGNINPTEARELMFRGYREFYTLRHMTTQLGSRMGTRLGTGKNILKGAAYELFARYMAHRQIHPMSGGVGLKKFDRAANWMDARREFYGFDYLPLPRNSKLSVEDAALNARVNLHGRIPLAVVS